MSKRLKDQILIKSCGVSILLETPDVSVREYLFRDPLPRNHFPCLEILNEGEDDIKPDFIFKHSIISSHIKPFIEQASDNYLELITSANVPPGQFVFAFLPIFEKLYEKNNLYGLHAASLRFNDWTVIIVGETKTGKSTISAKLHFDHNADFISDEKSIINIQEREVSGGTNIIALRKDAVASGHILADIEKFRIVDSKSTSKNYYNPGSLPKYPMAIKRILFVFPHFSSLSLSVEEINDFTLSYSLYENITGNIRACLSLFVSDLLPLPSQDSQDMADDRAMWIGELLKNVPHRAIDLTGDLKQILQQIQKEIS